MFGRFFYGQCSLAEAFWKFSFLGLAVSGFVTRLLMIFLKQSAGYETRYLQVLWNNISLLSMNPAAFTWLCFYTAAFFGRTDLFRRLYRRNVEHVQRIRKEQSPRFYLYASGLGNGLFCR